LYWFVGSASMLLAALWLARGFAGLRVWIASLATVLLFWCLLSIFYLVSDHFTGGGVDASVLFHLEYGLGSSGFGEYREVIAAAAVLLLLSVLAALAVYRYMCRAAAKDVTKRYHVAVIAVFLAGTSLLVHPASVDVASVYSIRWGVGAGSGIPFDLVEPAPGGGRSAEMLNLVYIYAESLERSYFDEQRFPGLMPNLKLLEKEAISFTGIQQIEGTGFTMAGMVASQCGVPLAVASDGNSMAGMDEFLPGAVCLGDLLNAHGYELSFLGGASLDFAGKGKFYRSHGFDRVQGLEELKGRLPDPDYVSAWGLYDDSLRALAKQELQRLAGVGRPFGMFLLTLDTHHPDGHLSRSCTGRIYASGDNPLLNAVHCADFWLGEFLRELRAGPLADRLLIVLGSDHLAMQGAATELLQTGVRRNLLMLWPPRSARHPSLEHRQGSALDVAPTVLSAMGLDRVALGFGRDLLRKAPTLAEATRDPARFFAARSEQLRRLWRFPSLEYGLLVDRGRGFARLGPRKIRIPSVIVLDEESDIEQVIFDSEWPERLPGYLSKLDVDTPFLLIDRCAAGPALGLESQRWSSSACQDSCLFAGRLQRPNIEVRPICDEAFFLREDLDRFTRSDGRLEPGELGERLARLESVHGFAAGRIGSMDVGVLDVAGPALEVRSSGFGAGYSYVQAGSLRPSFRSESEPLERGLSVIGIGSNPPYRKVLHVDTCSAAVASSASAGDSASLLAIREATRGDFDAWIVVAHDSAYCGSREPLARFFRDAPLKEWRNIGFRQPYIGVVARDGRSEEWLGDVEGSLLVTLQ
jgi:phosphoglycerol transferase